MMCVGLMGKSIGYVYVTNESLNHWDNWINWMETVEYLGLDFFASSLFLSFQVTSLFFWVDDTNLFCYNPQQSKLLFIIEQYIEFY